MQGLNSFSDNFDRLFIRDSNNNIVAQDIRVDASKTFTISSTTIISKVIFVARANSEYNDTEVNIMLNKGETALPYEEYSPEQVGMYDLSATSKNLFDKTVAVLNYYVNSSTGDLAESTVYFASDYIEVEQGEEYYWNDIKRGNAGAFYDSNKTYISGWSSSETRYVFTVPNGAKYVRLTGSKGDIDTYTLSKGSTALPYEPYQKRFYTNDGSGEFGYEYKGEKKDPTSATRLQANVANVNSTLSTDEFEPMQLEKDTVDLDNISKVDETKITDNINEEQIKSISKENHELE